MFWNPNCNWFNFISEGPYEWTQTLNLFKFTGEPILVMFNCERSGHKFSTFTDEELLADALKVLKIMFPAKLNLESALLDYRRTNWIKDPYAKMC